MCSPLWFNFKHTNVYCNVTWIWLTITPLKTQNNKHMKFITTMNSKSRNSMAIWARIEPYEAQICGAVGIPWFYGSKNVKSKLCEQFQQACLHAQHFLIKFHSLVKPLIWEKSKRICSKNDLDLWFFTDMHRFKWTTDILVTLYNKDSFDNIS